MDLTIEFTLNLITCKNIDSTINNINNIIIINNGIKNFSLYETEGARKIERNDYICSVLFNNKNNLLNFLKKIINLKNINIDCIYYANNIKYIYLSKRYAINNNLNMIKSIDENLFNISNLLKNISN
jgi:hypothetical protein